MTLQKYVLAVYDVFKLCYVYFIVIYDGMYARNMVYVLCCVYVISRISYHNLWWYVRMEYGKCTMLCLCHITNKLL